MGAHRDASLELARRSDVFADLVERHGPMRIPARTPVADRDLHRLDVWPTADLGVRAGYQRAFGLPDLPTPRELAELGADLAPVRSAAAWYCWRVLDTTTPDQAELAGSGSD